MDVYCVERGTLLDMPSIKTLERPEEHSVHCLVDVSVCFDSGFEVLRPVQGQENQYCRAFRLDAQGYQKALTLARSIGKPGSCTTCSGSGTQTKGFAVTVTGTISDQDVTPKVFNVRTVENGSVPCPEDLLIEAECAGPTGAVSAAVAAWRPTTISSICLAAIVIVVVDAFSLLALS